MALTRLCPFCLEPARECACPDTEALAVVPKCCEFHGRTCEPPSERCCEHCTEVHHGGWTDARSVQRHGHPPGETCSAPDLSRRPPGFTPDWRQA